MTPEADNAIKSTARTALAEYTNPNNTLTYRQALDKHAAKIAHLVPDKYRREPWLWLNYVCQRLANKRSSD
ncbi:hypothetical protein SY86_18530 [Erwinia tracheiphila]|uniref:Uncharacterized protein n=1 Tax=Erwinia tracheiphila TaxID=65700 RepID=A0A0M2KIA9_9GAMM|nr:hypothetical protein ETR_12303 [Erwinia tracheiphila PSU-1]KKF36968.1 hypothetical protein SY86_18530 [Erwinia tracheiphila]